MLKYMLCKLFRELDVYIVGKGISKAQHEYSWTMKAPQDAAAVL